MHIAKEKDEKKNSKQNRGSEILEHNQSNIWVFDVPENCEKIEHKKWDKINIWRDIGQIFLKFMKAINLLSQETQWTPSKRNTKKNTPRYTTIKWL